MFLKIRKSSNEDLKKILADKESYNALSTALTAFIAFEEKNEAGEDGNDETFYSLITSMSQCCKSTHSPVDLTQSGQDVLLTNSLQKLQEIIQRKYIKPSVAVAALQQPVVPIIVSFDQATLDEVGKRISNGQIVTEATLLEIHGTNFAEYSTDGNPDFVIPTISKIPSDVIPVFVGVRLPAVDSNRYGMDGMSRENGTESLDSILGGLSNVNWSDSSSDEESSESYEIDDSDGFYEEIKQPSKGMWSSLCARIGAIKFWFGRSQSSQVSGSAGNTVEINLGTFATRLPDQSVPARQPSVFRKLINFVFGFFY